MKSILIALLFTLGSIANLSAQNFTVRVVSGKEPLAYAYIFINKKIICSADSSGIAVFPQKLLNLGDTISVSYVGASPGMAIYSEEVAGKGECTIGLQESVYLKDIIVRGQDASNKMFKKYFKPLFVGNYHDFYTGNFKVIIKGLNMKKDVNGDFKYTALPYNPEKRGLKSNLELNTNSDTIHFEKLARYSLGVFNNALYMAALWKGAYMNKGMIAVYKGETPINRIFLITRPQFYTDKYTVDDVQQLIYVDKKSGYLNSADILMIGRNGKWRYNFKAYYSINKKYKNIFPNNIEGEANVVTDKGEVRCNVIIDQIEYHRKR